MEILSLNIKNFLTIGEAELKLNDRGLLLVAGVNDDDSSGSSNGAGKSSISDALCWGLYGETARGVGGDAVVNRTAKKDCSVQVLLKDDDTYYRITRYRKHKEFKNQTVVETTTPPVDDEPSEWLNLSKGTEKETQLLIDGIMGSTLPVFQAAVYAGQEMMPDLPGMTDKNLKVLIEEAAGVERLTAAYQIARDRLIDAKEGLLTAQHNTAVAKNKLTFAEESCKTAEVAVKEFEDGRKDREAGFLESAELYKKGLNISAAEYKAVAIKDIDTQITALTARIAGSDEAKRRVADKQSEIHSIDTRMVLTERTVRDTLTRVTTLKAEIERPPKDMIGKPCDECGKPYTADDLEKVIAEKRVKLADEVAQAKAHGVTLNAQKASKLNEEAVLKELQALVPDTKADSEELTRLNGVRLNMRRLENAIRTDKAGYDEQIARSKQALTDPNPHTANHDRIAASLANLREHVEEFLEVEKSFQAKVDLANNAVAVFGPAGVRAHILDTVTPFLNERTSAYLGTLSDGNIHAVWTTLSATSKGDLREKFTIDVTNDVGADSFAGLSGGEKRKVRLATMLALQDLVASRATKPIRIWIGDEIDDALDSAGLERLMGILEQKARERGTVMVVSHNELRDWIDTVITVTKKDGYSSVVSA